MDPHDNWDYDDALDVEHSENVILEADSVGLRGTPVTWRFYFLTIKFNR